ncbi:MAG TPA: TatD family hydrolase [Candidatus Paceibacterota bacterium]
MLIDTHAHINFNAFKDDGEEVLKRTLEAGMQVIMPGSQYSTSKRAVEIAERYEQGVYAAVGLHPIHIGEQRKVDVLEVQSSLDFARAFGSEAQARRDKQSWEEFETRAEEFDYEAYKKLGQSKKTVAIGEIGLDYYYFPKSKARREEIMQKQKAALQAQMDLADELGLPVILHCRVAHEDLLEFLASRFTFHASGIKGVVHSYTGTAEQAQKFMDLGLYLGFNGLILKNVPALPNPRELITSIPLERIVLETDSPYLTPPKTPKERNEPLFLQYVAEEIARIKKVSFEEVAKQTTENAKKLFTV